MVRTYLPRRRLRGRRPAHLVVGLVAAAILAAACAADDEPTTGSDPGESEEQDDQVLAPLDSGFPDGPITLWQAFSPGHTDDLLNQLVADIASDYSPVPIATEGRESGPEIHFSLGEFLLQQPRANEGYHTYVHSVFGAALRPYTIDTLVGRSEEENVPYLGIRYTPDIIAVAADSEFETLDDVVQWATENPGELTGVAGPTGGGNMVALTRWADDAGLDLRFIPTENVAEGRQVLMGGGATIASLNNEVGIDDQVRVVAVTGDDRASNLPDVPALGELGYDSPWGTMHAYAYYAEMNVPEENVEWMHELMLRVVRDARFAEAQEGFEVMELPHDEVVERRAALLDATLPILGELGIRVDQ